MIHPMSPDSFSYEEAFCRNLGWITLEESKLLKTKTVAIAGMGGVGGQHLVTLARLGIQKFHIADFDTFELANFNRQEGANLQTLGKKKIEVMKERVTLINPNIEVRSFNNGITKENLHQFLSGVDLYIDGIDALEVDIRWEIFQACHIKNIPGITVGPIGMGGALMNFLPGHMSFENYFGFSGKDKKEKFLRLILGLTPSFAQIKSMVDKSFVDFQAEKMPSTPMGCLLASGIAGTEALKILLSRGPISHAPTSIHFDAYTNKVYQKYLPWGHKNPLFQLKLALAKKRFRLNS